MNNMIDQVFTFNEKVLNLYRDKGLLSDRELEYALKAGAEELKEFSDAHFNQDFIAAVDGVLDLIYFSLGFLKRMGLTRKEVELCFTAVHEANMAKKLGVQQKRGGDGVADAIKPAEWVSPEERIMEILDGHHN